MTLQQNIVLLVMFLALPCTYGADVQAYLLMKQQGYLQTNVGNVILYTNKPFAFSAGVAPSAPNAVLSGSIRLPNSSTKPLTNSPAEEAFILAEDFWTQAEMDAAFPSGTYTFQIQTANDGTRSPTLAISGNGYPNAPRLTNFAAAQAIEAAENFVLRWNAFNGGTSNDLIQVHIYDEFTNSVFAVPSPENPTVLNGTRRAVTVPANTLEPRRSYKGYLVFLKLNNRNLTGYPGAVGVSYYGRTTELPLRTVGPLQLHVLQNRPFQFRFETAIGQTYTIHTSSNLTTWSTVLTTNARTASFTYTDNQVTNRNRRFYRVYRP